MGRWRTAIIFASFVFAALSAFVLAGAREVEQADARLAQAELEFILTEAAQTIERGLQLGLPLADLQQVDPLLARVMRHSSAITAADVFSPASVTLFSTDRGAVGEPVPQAWVSALDEDTRRKVWRAQDPATLVIGTRLSNDFGATEGWIALLVDRRAIAAPLSRTPALFAEALPLIALAALVAGISGYLLAARADRRLVDALAALKSGRPPTARDGALRGAIAAAVEGTEAAQTAVEDTAAELAILDAKV